jgi:hypothetical protein
MKIFTSIAAVTAGLRLTGCSNTPTLVDSAAVLCDEVKGSMGSAKIQFNKTQAKVFGYINCDSEPYKELGFYGAHALECPTKRHAEVIVAHIRYLCEPATVVAP